MYQFTMYQNIHRFNVDMQREKDGWEIHSFVKNADDTLLVLWKKSCQLT